MQMSAAVWRNAVCGPGCAEIVVLGDGDIGHPPPAEADGFALPGRRWRRLPAGTLAARSVCTGVLPSDRIWVLRTTPMCRMVEVAVAAASEQSIFVAPLAVAGSVPDRGCYRAGPRPYPNSTRHRRSRWGRSPPLAPANAPWSSARRSLPAFAAANKKPEIVALAS